MEVEGMSRTAALRDFSVSAAAAVSVNPKKTPAAGSGQDAAKAKAKAAGKSAPARVSSPVAAPVKGGNFSFEQPAAKSGNVNPGQPATVAARQESAGAAQSDAAAGQEERKYEETMAKKAFGDANDQARLKQNRVEFGYNDKINRFTITFKGAEDGEVIKEIPPEQTQRMLEKLYTMSGLMMDTEV